ncbi:MAG TPA: NAD-dependent epimerase/dehydratase family protein [Gemmatimonadaceae bacterium]|nr:NAD-dependent epimerase/dehydratase family protein [Gemmatimonadaceae bacterium]
MKRALVTGGAGFIGSHVADRFASAGYRVEIIDNLSSGRRENVPSSAVLHNLDVGSPEAAEIVQGGSFDVVAHLAAQMDVRKSVADPRYDAGVNILGTLNVIEAIRKSKHASRLVFTSTGGAVYGVSAHPPTVETSPKEPESPYAISKLTVEYYLAYYHRLFGLEAAVLRFGNVYGPRQDPAGEAGVVSIFCNRILDGRPLTVFGNGMQTRDYIYVSDVVDAVWRGATGTLPNDAGLDARAFNVGTSIGTSVLDLASHLQRAAGTDLPLEFASKRPGEQQDSYIAIDKANHLLGWEPKVELPEGLAITYEWFASNRLTGATGKS